MLPAHNTRIVFDRAPPGSYCRAGEVFTVEHRRSGDDYRLISTDGASTYERPQAIKRAAWRVVEG